MNHCSSYDRLDISVGWHDTTKYGSVLSGRLEATLRERLYPRTFALLSAEMTRPARLRTVRAAVELAELVRAERATPQHRAVIEDPAFWSHDPGDVEPASVTLRAPDAACELRLSVDAQRCRDLRSELGGCTSGGELTNALARLMRPLTTRSRSLVTSAPFEPLLVGHACVSWSDGARRLWIDPFLRPKRDAYPEQFTPLSPFDFIECEHAVLLTHAHPDHFDPGSLFWFPNDTHFIVPAAQSDTPLTLRLDVRLRQLGFTNIRTIGEYETTTFGDFEIAALPFFGEQPLGLGASPGPRAGDRNIGNTYLVRSEKGGSALLLADSGADPTGSILAEARHIRARFGPIDALFCNHRRWRLYPPQYLVSSVPQFLCYVPDAELSVAQRIMLEADEVWALADALGARSIVPYAMGGAPWFAELGLGFDPFRAHRRTAFDTAPADLRIPHDADSLLQPSAQARDLLPGQGLPPQGLAWWLPGRGPAVAADFFTHPPQRPQRALALSGDAAAALVPNLIELTRVDPSAWLVAGPDFCELSTAGSADLLFALALRLNGGRAGALFGPAPMCMGIFAEPTAWRVLFGRMHRSAFHALRDATDPLTRLRSICRSSPFTGIAPELIEQIAFELLGLDLNCAHGFSARSGRAALRARTQLSNAPELHLPPQAGELVRRHGATDVACALLLVKLVHNMWLTSQDGQRRLAADEDTLFQRLIGRERTHQSLPHERKQRTCTALQTA